MADRHSTLPPKAYPGNEGRNLPRYVTIAVLVAGVVGGLIIVISVIVFCKYCIRKKKVLKRTVRSYKPRREYSTVDTAPSSAKPDPCKTAQYEKKPGHGSSQPPAQGDPLKVSHNDEENEIDYAVAQYIEQIKAEDRPYDGSQDRQQTARVSTETEEDTSVTGRQRHRAPAAAAAVITAPLDDVLLIDSPLEAASRRVSFLRCDSLAAAAAVAVASSSSSGFAEQSTPSQRGYEEGEYQRGKVVKQRSLGKQSSFGGIGQGYGPADTPSTDEGITEVTPMLTPVNEELDSPTMSSRHRTEVSVEVHREASNSSGSCTNNGCSPPRSAVPSRIVPRLSRHGGRHAISLELASTSSFSVSASAHERWGRDARRARSYEETSYHKPRHSISSAMHDISPRDYYDRLEITQFNRGPFYSADYDLMSEIVALSDRRSRVRYNDLGSFDDLTEQDMRLLDTVGISSGFMDSDPVAPASCRHRSRDLWSLRKTFEEEEDFSDTIRMEDMLSPEDHSTEERDQATSYTTSFESNTEVVTEAEQSSDRSDQPSSEDTVIRKTSSSLLGPSYENRRQTYRSILSKRLRKVERSTSADNSFDSVETIETDGDVSESSRPDFTTTSFESTTDNTDSTGDGQTHRLQQMRGDSGYKSLETQASQQQAQLTPPRSLKKQIHFALDHESIDKDGAKSVSKIFSDEPVYSRHSVEAPETYGSRRNSKKAHFERRNGKTASKKRREYRAERQMVYVSESVHEADTDSRSDQPSGDSFDDNFSPRKQSLFSRFLRRHSADGKRQSLSRDYSVDEKTDALFNEFVRYDPTLDSKSVGAFSLKRTSPRLPAARPKLHRKQTEPTLVVGNRRRERLYIRSASLGSDSSAGSLRKLSPQDSIEEEYLEMEAARTWEGYRRPGLGPSTPSKRDSRKHGVPLIRLPDDGSGSK